MQGDTEDETQERVKVLKASEQELTVQSEDPEVSDSEEETEIGEEGDAREEEGDVREEEDHEPTEYISSEEEQEQDPAAPN